MSITVPAPRGPTRRPVARTGATAYATGAATRSPTPAVLAPFHAAHPAASADAEATTAPTAESSTWDAAWACALERSELDLADVEAMLVRLRTDPDHVPDTPAPWIPLPRLGPLPASMAVRAQAVLKRHQSLAEELTVAITENRRHRKAITSLRRREAAAPVYIDTEA